MIEMFYLNFKNYCIKRTQKKKRKNKKKKL